MRVKINKVVWFLLLISIGFASCAVFGKNSYKKQCGCPSRKAVG